MEQRPLHWSERAKMYPGPAADAAKSRKPEPPQPEPEPGGTEPEPGGTEPEPPQPEPEPGDTEPEPDGDQLGGTEPPEQEPKTGSSHKGFLITLLIILIAAAAAVVIFLWYLPSRDSDDGASQSQDQQQEIVTTTVQTTVMSTDTTQTGTPVTGAVATAKDVEAMTLVYDSMLAVQSIHAAAGTYDLPNISADLMESVETTATFVIRDDDQAAKAPTALSSNMAVDFFGTATGFALGTVSESGRSFGVTVNTDSTTSGTTYYVDGQVQDWSAQLTAR